MQHENLANFIIVCLIEAQWRTFGLAFGNLSTKKIQIWSQHKKCAMLSVDKHAFALSVWQLRHYLVPNTFSCHVCCILFLCCQCLPTLLHIFQNYRLIKCLVFKKCLHIDNGTIHLFHGNWFILICNVFHQIIGKWKFSKWPWNF